MSNSVDNGAREGYVSIIEQQSPIAGRFGAVQRIDHTAGDGHFSLVFKATDQTTGKPVALKFYSPLKMGENYRLRCFERESVILKRLRGQQDILQLVTPKSELLIELRDPHSGIPLPVGLTYIVTELAVSNVRHYIFEERTDALKNLVLSCINQCIYS